MTDVSLRYTSSGSGQPPAGRHAGQTERVDGLPSHGSTRIGAESNDEKNNVRTVKIVSDLAVDPCRPAKRGRIIAHMHRICGFSPLTAVPERSCSLHGTAGWIVSFHWKIISVYRQESELLTRILEKRFADAELKWIPGCCGESMPFAALFREKKQASRTQAQEACFLIIRFIILQGIPDAAKGHPCAAVHLRLSSHEPLPVAMHPFVICGS